MLHCLNCKADVPADEGRIFAQVFVCPRCFSLAESFYERSLYELRRLEVALRESVRLALLEGRLQFSAAPDHDLSKRDVLRAVVLLEELRHADASHAGPGDPAHEPEDR